MNSRVTSADLSNQKIEILGMPITVGPSVANVLDSCDPLAHCKENFAAHQTEYGRPVINFTGNSLGPRHKGSTQIYDQIIKEWDRLGVAGYFIGEVPFVTYRNDNVTLKPALARLVGAAPHEIGVQGGLTGNLQILLEAFYSPQAEADKIMMIYGEFVSDQIAVRTHLAVHHGLPQASEEVTERILKVNPREGEYLIRDEDICDAIREHCEKLSVVVVPAVIFSTGQALDIEKIARTVQEVVSSGKNPNLKIVVDCAHAIGSVKLQLHDWKIDGAVWCHYKYLCGGPGVPGGIYVREDHIRDPLLPQHAGWFGMKLGDLVTALNSPDAATFTPNLESADRFSTSNVAILALPPLIAALGEYEKAGFDAMLAKQSNQFTYLRFLLNSIKELPFVPVTGEMHGNQLSIALTLHNADDVKKALLKRRISVDTRAPNIIRVGIGPLWNSYQDIWKFYNSFKEALETLPAEH
jgi:kynureninase